MEKEGNKNQLSSINPVIGPSTNYVLRLTFDTNLWYKQRRFKQLINFQCCHIAPVNSSALPSFFPVKSTNPLMFSPPLGISGFDEKLSECSGENSSRFSQSHYTGRGKKNGSRGGNLYQKAATKARAGGSAARPTSASLLTIPTTSHLGSHLERSQTWDLFHQGNFQAC